MPDPAKKPEEVVVTEENAAEIARQEIEKERKDADPNYQSKVVPENPPAEGEEQEPSGQEAPPGSPDPTEKTDEQLLEASDDDLNDAEKDRKKVLVDAAAAEEDRLLNTPEEELSPEDKEKREIVRLQRETRDKEAHEETVKAYAQAKEMPVEDARKIMDSIDRIKTKYENDPFKIAEAVLDLQHLITRKDDEIRTVKARANQPRGPQNPDEWERVLKAKGIKLGDKWLTWEQGVEQYRKEEPELTQGLEDSQVLKIIARSMHTKVEAHQEKQLNALRKKADEKRDKLVAGIPEDSQRFAENVKELLGLVPDDVIVDEGYSVGDAVKWARGDYYTPEKIKEIVREAELKGFKRGQAVNKKPVSGPASSATTTRPGKTKPALTTAEQDEARDMFPNVKDDEEAFALYADIKAHREKNKKTKKE